ncbi:aspartic peptidase domain-containing protein [Suillus fuscotomentosus]|uniref:Aspartic peptidase domain-containing protein n=1 Tax=Suillus fuscotomentosus TaxID=1912939 RepID=A0AAD4HN30_9AGAM|nr:aspartic peptidase domain-containing protein [Suillus fuscotomentosus]KAG1901319.1 aspartic peptidase domain-containing protein [Suillus fuscotomentosus]
MMHSFITLSFVSSLCSTISVLALRIPFDVHVQTPANNPTTHFPRQSSSNGILPVGNTQNSFYYTNIMLGGQNISVMLDTGSSDLWVTGSIPGATDTVGTAAGIPSVSFFVSPLRFLTSSAVLVANVSSFSTNIHSEGYDGLIGLGPNSGSSIYKKLDGNSGNNPINRIFEQTSSNDYITMMLSRKGDPGSNITGQFTIGELVPGFENITSMPHLSIEKVYRVTDVDQHWQIVTDKNNGIIGPDGQPIKYSSIAPKAPDGTIVGVLDSGFTLPQVPRTVSDAIYGRVQGAEWSVANEAWLVPCGQLINVTFNFGGVSYPIHPLDVSSSDFGVTFSNGNPACLGTFQPVTSAFSLLGEYDMILGMAFLRNTYALINYGNFITGGSNSNNPYIQLLPLTNVESAVNDFIQVRLNGQNTINSSQYALLPASQEQHSPESAAEKKQAYEELVLSRWPYIVVGGLVLLILLISYCVWRCCCRRKRMAKKAAKKAAQQNGGAASVDGFKSGPYAQLHDSQSTASLVMQPMRGSTVDFEEDYGGKDAFTRSR